MDLCDDRLILANAGLGPRTESASLAHTCHVSTCVNKRRNQCMEVDYTMNKVSSIEPALQWLLLS
jgi:hypothetical protein